MVKPLNMVKGKVVAINDEGSKLIRLDEKNEFGDEMGQIEFENGKLFDPRPFASLFAMSPHWEEVSEEKEE